MIAIITIAIPFSLYLLYQGIRLITRGAGEQVTLSLNPATANVPPNTTQRLLLDAKTNQVGFIRAEFTFDRTKVRLADDPQVTQAQFTNIVEKTTAASDKASAEKAKALELAVGAIEKQFGKGLL